MAIDGIKWDDEPASAAPITGIKWDDEGGGKRVGLSAALYDPRVAAGVIMDIPKAVGGFVRAIPVGARAAGAAVGGAIADAWRGDSVLTTDALQSRAGQRYHQSQADIAAADRDFREIQGEFEDNSLGYHAAGIGRSLAPMAAGIGLSAVTRNPVLGASVVGLSSGADAYMGARAEGSTRGEAGTLGVAHGVFEAGTEYLTLGVLKYGAGPVIEKLSKYIAPEAAAALVKRAGQSTIGRVAGAGAVEALGEVATTTGQMGADELIADKDYSLDDYIKGWRDSAIQGGAMGAGAYAATAGLSSRAEARQRERLNRAGALTPGTDLIGDGNIAAELDARLNSEDPNEVDLNAAASQALEGAEFVNDEDLPVEQQLADIATVSQGNLQQQEQVLAEEAANRPYMADAPPRELGETDKAYIDRVINKMPPPDTSKLVDDPARYFEFGDDVQMADIGELIVTKEGRDGGNAARNFAAASEGAIAKRPSIDVRLRADGKMEVIDGNGTTTAARDLGWKQLPIRIVEAEAPGKWQKVDGEIWNDFVATVPNAARAAVAEANRPKDAPVDPHQSLGILTDRGATKALNEDMRRAEKALPRFRALVTSIAQSLGVKPKVGDLKGRRRAEEKIRGKVADNPDYRAKDLVRATLVADTVAEADALYNKLVSEQTLGAPYIDADGKMDGRNHWADGADALDPSGYRDAQLVVRLENGTLAEVQISTPAMMEAKEAGHKYYEIVRSVDAAAIDRARRNGDRPAPGEKMSDFAERMRTPRERALVERATEAMNKLYSGAFIADSRSTSRQNQSASRGRMLGTDGESDRQYGSGMPPGDTAAQQNSPTSPGSANNGVPSSSAKREPSGSEPRTNGLDQSNIGESSSGDTNKVLDKATEVKSELTETKATKAQREIADRSAETARKTFPKRTFVVVDSIDEIPAGALEGADVQGDEKAFFGSDGVIYLNASAVESVRDMRESVLHEITHAGLREVIPAAEFDAAMVEIWKHAQASTDRTIRTMAVNVANNYADQSDAVKGEEVLAAIGERYNTNIPAPAKGVLSPIFKAMRAVMRRMGLLHKVSDDAIYDLVRKAHAAERDGGSEAKAGGARAKRAAKSVAKELSSRVPTAKKATENAIDTVLSVSYAQALKDAKTLEKNAKALAEVPNMTGVTGTAEEIVEKAITHMVANLQFLHDLMPAEVRQRARLWYDGGRKLAETWAERYGVSEMQAAAAIAVLSPQNDWYQNVSMAERVADAVFGMRDFMWSDAMSATADEIAKGPTGNDPLMAQARGKTLGELLGNPAVAARWIRAFDQTHNSRKFRVLTPEGGASDWMRTKSGTESTVAWKTYGALAKAVSVLTDGRMENIHAQLGNEHKVRNFYNNIAVPNSELGFATIDTHAMAGAWLRPLAGSSIEVIQGFGGAGSASSSITGLSGTYALYLEAYKRAAEANGILPREMQSITWEAVRGVFEAAQKQHIRKRADEIWGRHAAGEITQSDAQAEILELAGGFTLPNWTSEPFNNTPARSYEGDGAKAIDARPAEGDTASRVLFEVAPDPNDAELTAQWDSLSDEAKVEVSADVAAKIVPQVMDALGTHGDFSLQLGGYLGATNPSLTLEMDRPELLLTAAKMLGHALAQDSMMVVAPRAIIGADKTGVVKISLPEGYGAKQITALYDKLWELEHEGEKLVGGHTTVDGEMAILNFSSLDNDTFANLIDSHLDGEFDVTHGDVYAAFPQKEDYGYGSQESGTGGEVVRAESPVQQRGDRLRAEASRLLADGIRERSDAAGDRRGGEVPAREGGAKARRSWNDRPVQADAVEVTGRHYSNTAGLTALDPSKYGSNHAGAEKKRIDNAIWHDEKYEPLLNRVYFYPEGSPLYAGESMVGRADSHDLTLGNMYDADADPRDLWEVAETMAGEDNVDDSSAFELAVIEAGFDGWFTTDMGVVLNTKPIAVGGARARRFIRSGDRPGDYILADGAKELAQIPRALAIQINGRAAGPVVLKVGTHSESRANGRVINSKGYGLAHIEERHGGDIRSLGMSVEEFVDDVANNWEQAYKQVDRDGRVRLVLTKRTADGLQLQVLEAQRGGEWNVITAYVTSLDRFKADRQKLIAGGGVMKLLNAKNENATARVASGAGSQGGGTVIDSSAASGNNVSSNTPGALGLRPASPTLQPEGPRMGTGNSSLTSNAPIVAQKVDATGGARSRRASQGQAGFTGYTIPTESFEVAYANASGNMLRRLLAGLAASGRRFRRIVQDDLLPLKQITDFIRENGNYDDAVMNSYQMTELFHGRAGDRIARFRFDHVQPFVEALHSSGLTMAELDDFMYALFAPQRNRTIYEANRDRKNAADFVDGKSGMTNREAKDILDAFQKAGKTPQLMSLANRVYRMHAHRIDILESSGLITADQAAEWRAEPNYVPLRGFADGREIAFEGGGAGRTGKGMSVSGSESMRAKGRNSRAADLVATSIAMVETSILRAEKNRVAQSVIAMVASNPNPDLWELAKAKTVLVRDKVTGELIEDSVGDPVLRRFYPTDREPAVFSAKVDGKEVMVRFKGEAGERLATGLKNLGAANLGAALRKLRVLNRWLSMARTTLNPEFVITNFARDIQTAMTNLTQEQGAALARQTFKGIKPAMAAIFRHERSGMGNGGNAKFDRYFREFLADGGKTDFGAARDIDQVLAEIDTELAKADRSSAHKALAGAFEVFMAANTAVENAPRLAAYVAAREAGMSRKDAAAIGKNLTVNFNRRGTAGPTINAFYMFANASIQGTARFAQFVAHNPKKAALYWAAPMFATGFIVSVMNTMLGGEDDDGEDRWAKVSDYDRDRNLIIMIGERRVKIPLPYIYSLPYTMGVRVADYVQGHTKASTAAAGIMASILDGINPLGSAQSALHMVAPTLLDPVADIYTNMNFTGSPLRPEQSFEKYPVPDSEKAFRNTPGAYKWMSEAMNALTGGSSVRKGWVDVAPSSISTWVNFFGGGVWGFGEKLAGIVAAPFEGELPEAHRIPFVGKVYGADKERQASTDYYLFREDAAAMGEEAGLLAETGGLRGAGAEERAKYGMSIAISAQLKGAEKQLAGLRKARNAADEMGEDERVERLEEQMLQVQGRFNKAYVAMKRKAGEPVR